MQAVNVTVKQGRPCTWIAFAVLAYLWTLFFVQNARTWLAVEDYQYGWAAPFLFLYFLYRRWRQVPAPGAPRAGWRVPAVAACVLLAILICPIRVLLEANPDWRPLLWGMAFTVVLFSLATAYCLGGMPYVRHFAFPVLFPLSAVPWPGHIEIPVTLTFMKVGTAVAAEILNACGIVALPHGTVLETANGYIGVDEACSGIKSFQTMVLIGLALSELSGARGLRRLKTVGVGWLLAFTANLGRITFLAWMGALYGTAALEKWHDAAGTAAFAVSGFLLVFLEFRPGAAAQTPAPDRPVPPPVPAAAFAACLALCLAAEGVTWWWYRQGPSGLRAPWSVTWSRLGDSVSPIELSPRVLGALQCDAGSAQTWRTDDGHPWVGYFFKWNPGMAAFFARNQHSPELCLPSSGRRLVSDIGYRTFDSGDVRILVKHLVFDDGGVPLNVFFIVDGSGVATSEEVLSATTLAGRLRAFSRHSNRADRRSLELIASGYDAPRPRGSRLPRCCNG